jgi:hypothetical protein
VNQRVTYRINHFACDYRGNCFNFDRVSQKFADNDPSVFCQTFGGIKISSQPADCSDLQDQLMRWYPGFLKGIQEFGIREYVFGRAFVTLDRIIADIAMTIP